MKLETFKHIMRIDELKSKLKSETALESVVSITKLSDSQFLVKVVITNFLTRMNVVIDRHVQLIGDLLSLDMNI